MAFSILMILDLIIFFLLGPTLLVFGWIGNLTGLLLLIVRNLKDIGPVLIYKVLFAWNSIYLFVIVFTQLNIFGINPSLVSDFICKLIDYSFFASASFMPMILVYISADRFISVKFPSRNSFLKKNTTQIAYLVSIFTACLIFYSPSAIFSQIVSINTNTTQNITRQCMMYNSKEEKFIMLILDLGFRNIFIFCLMLLFTILLIHCIISSRRRVFANYTSSQNRLFKKDLRLSITLVVINVLFLVFDLPITLVTFAFQQTPPDMTILSYFIYFSTYSLTFYMFLGTNSVFRKKFISLFKKNTLTNTTNN